MKWTLMNPIKEKIAVYLLDRFDFISFQLILISQIDIRFTVPSRTVAIWKATREGRTRSEQNPWRSRSRLSSLSWSPTDQFQLPWCSSGAGDVCECWDRMPSISCVPRWTWRSSRSIFLMHKRHHFQSTRVHVRLVVQRWLRTSTKLLSVSTNAKKPHWITLIPYLFYFQFKRGPRTQSVLPKEEGRRFTQRPICDQCLNRYTEPV